jgi:4-hydroxybenzoate polyprenyltransferase
MVIGRILKTVWQEFIYGGHLQSLGAASIVFTSAILLGTRITLDGLFVAYLIFYPLYLYNRFKEIKIDYLTNIERTKHLQKYSRFIPFILFSIIFILIVSLIYFSNLRALIFGLLLLSFGLLYTPIFKKLTKIIILFKDLYVAAFFSLLVFFFIVYSSYSLSTILIIGVIVFMVFVYLKAFLMQIFLDIKDLEIDKREGLLTFPTIFGKEKTLNILKIISILTTIPIPLIFSLSFNVFPKSILMLLLTIPFNFYCFSLAQKQRYSGYILASGEFILWPILILIGETIL